MTLRTQNDPYVLVGDIADLPPPATIAQGTIFHADDTSASYVLVIDQVTHARSWVLIGQEAGSVPQYLVAALPSVTSVGSGKLAWAIDGAGPGDTGAGTGALVESKLAGPSGAGWYVVGTALLVTTTGSSSVTVYLDAVAGNDSNSGLTTIAPVKTLPVAISRVRQIGASGQSTIQVLSTTLPLGTNPVINWPLLQPGAPTLILQGLVTTVATATVASATAGTFAPMVQATITVAGTPWAAHAFQNMIFQITSGTNKGERALIVDNTNNTLTLQLAFTGPVPIAGNTFSILQQATTLNWLEASGSVDDYFYGDMAAFVSNAPGGVVWDSIVIDMNSASAFENTLITRGIHNMPGCIVNFHRDATWPEVNLSAGTTLGASQIQPCGMVIIGSTGPTTPALGNGNVVSSAPNIPFCFLSNSILSNLTVKCQGSVAGSLLNASSVVAGNVSTSAPVSMFAGFNLYTNPETNLGAAMFSAQSRGFVEVYDAIIANYIGTGHPIAECVDGGRIFITGLSGTPNTSKALVVGALSSATITDPNTGTTIAGTGGNGFYVGSDASLITWATLAGASPQTDLAGGSANPASVFSYVAST